jgi:hypothetical protein
MNIQTGDVYRIEDAEQLKRLKAEQGEMLKLVPEKHKAEAETALAGKDHGRVDMSVHTPLVGWANKERVALKNKERAARKKGNRARMVKASRKRNRGK